MKLLRPLSLLPGFLTGCLCCGVLWQIRRSEERPAVDLPSPTTPATLPSRQAQTVPSWNDADLDLLAAALPKALLHDNSGDALDIITGLSWEHAAALLSRHWSHPASGNQRAGLAFAEVVFSRMTTLDASFSLDWALRHAPETDRTALLDPLVRFWKKKDPEGWKKWLARNEARIRPADPDNKFWSAWNGNPSAGRNNGIARQPDTASTPAAPPRPIAEIFEELESQIKTGSWKGNGFSEWLKLSGQYRDAMARAALLEDRDWRRSVTGTITDQWVRADFRGWAEWADALPAPRRDEAYESNSSLRHISMQLQHWASTLAGEPDAETSALCSVFLRAESLDRIVAATADSQRSPVIGLVRTWLLRDPAAAEDWLAKQEEAPWMDGLRNGQAQSMMNDDPVAAFSVAAAIRNSKSRSQCMRQVFDFWLSEEPLAAAAYVAERYPDLAEEWRRADAAR